MKRYEVADVGSTTDMQEAADGAWVLHEDAEVEIAKLKEALGLALGALADIANSDDMTLTIARKQRITRDDR